MGVVSPLGHTLETFWNALLDGTSGVGPPTGTDLSGFPSRIAGEVRGFDPSALVEKKDRKRLNQMSREFRLAVGAAAAALADAGLTPGAVEPERFGIEFGAGSQSAEMSHLGPAALAALTGPDRIDLRAWGERGLPLVPPTWLLNYIPNIGAGYLSILHDARGPGNTVTQGDAAGVLAVGEAVRVIRRGRADVMLVGGSDTKFAHGHVARFNLAHQLSRRNDEPERACRPFDRDRDGSVLAEGAGFLVLEQLNHARARGARIYAEVVGFASGFDGALTGLGLRRVIQSALGDIAPARLDHVNAHGYGDRTTDVWEARGISALGAVPVLAVKSFMGDAGAGAGVIELVASLLALDRGTVPATLNYETPDPDCPIDVSRVPRAVARDCVLKVGLTTLGQCGAVVVRRWVG
jgi:3-oxoacyl-[acyl-carrier-protein] synthase II